MSNSLQPHGMQRVRLLCQWNSAGKNTGVGSLSLLQGIFLTQGSNLGLLQCRQILYCLILYFPVFESREDHFYFSLRFTSHAI